jgi:hypothetical protein
MTSPSLTRKPVAKFTLAGSEGGSGDEIAPSVATNIDT